MEIDGAGSGRQPRRRRALRRTDRHVPRRGDAGVRVLARPRADPRRDGGAEHVSAASVRAGVGGRPASRSSTSATIPEVAAAGGELRAGRRPRRGLPGAGQAGQADEVRRDAKEIPFAAVLGGDEIARGEVTIKNLETGRAAVGAACNRRRRRENGQVAVSWKPHQRQPPQRSNRRTGERRNRILKQKVCLLSFSCDVLRQECSVTVNHGN